MPPADDGDANPDRTPATDARAATSGHAAASERSDGGGHQQADSAEGVWRRFAAPGGFLRLSICTLPHPAPLCTHAALPYRGSQAPPPVAGSPTGCGC